MKGLLDWVLLRSLEKSTWVAVIGLLTAAGVHLTTDQSSGLIAAILAVAAVVNAFIKENGSADSSS